MTRRRFLRFMMAASGAVALDRSWLEGRPEPAIAVLGASEDTGYGRGAILGIEEGERAAGLLRRALPVVRSAGPDDRSLRSWARGLREQGVLTAVSALPGPEQAGFERATVAEGMIAVDARVARPDVPEIPAVFRTGLPATAYGLALLRFLAPAEPRWKWALVAEEHAPDRLLDSVRRVLGARRLTVDVSGGSARLEGEEFDAVVWVGDDSAGHPVGALRGNRPVVRLDPGGGAVHPPVAGSRPLLWHPELFRYGAEQLNERYRRRFGRGMDGEAWAGWMAVKAVSEAILRSRAGSREELLELLGGRRAAFDGHKGAPLSFTARGRTLSQPLYVVGDGGTTEMAWPLEEAIHEG